MTQTERMKLVRDLVKQVRDLGHRPTTDLRLSEAQTACIALEEDCPHDTDCDQLEEDIYEENRSLAAGYESALDNILRTFIANEAKQSKE